MYIPISGNLTLKDILVNEPLLSAYLRDVFRLSPDLVRRVLDGRVDIAKLVSRVSATGDN